MKSVIVRRAAAEGWDAWSVLPALRRVLEARRQEVIDRGVITSPVEHFRVVNPEMFDARTGEMSPMWEEGVPNITGTFEQLDGDHGVLIEYEVHAPGPDGVGCWSETRTTLRRIGGGWVAEVATTQRGTWYYPAEDTFLGKTLFPGVRADVAREIGAPMSPTFHEAFNEAVERL